MILSKQLTKGIKMKNVEKFDKVLTETLTYVAIAMLIIGIILVFGSVLGQIPTSTEIFNTF